MLQPSCKHAMCLRGHMHAVCYMHLPSKCTAMAHKMAHGGEYTMYIYMLIMTLHAWRNATLELTSWGDPGSRSMSLNIIALRAVIDICLQIAGLGSYDWM